MKFNFQARIYKIGINPCVKVPRTITTKMKPTKGYIPVMGMIGRHKFKQTLCPVKGEPYRLHVNGPMLKGSGTKMGDIVNFSIEQNLTRPDTFPMPDSLRKQLVTHKLMPVFEGLTPSRRKEILRYLNNLKTKDALTKNIGRVINALQGNAIVPYVNSRK